MNEGKTLYFIGAGASKAAWSRMPLMTDFLDLGLEYARAAKDPDEAWPYWKMMALHEILDDGVWGQPTGKKLATEFLFPQSNIPYKKLGESLLTANDRVEKQSAIQKYLERLDSHPPEGYSRSDRLISRHQASIEFLLTRAERHALETDDDRAFHATKDFIVWILGKVEGEATTGTAANAFDFLARAIKANQHLLSTHFVSFNYDVLLERALERLNPTKEEANSARAVWSARNNFGVGFERYFRQDDAISGRPLKAIIFQSIRKGSINVLKPHGSIYWFLENSSEGWRGPLLNDSDPAFPVLPTTGDSFLRIIQNKAKKPGEGLEPILIPPSPTKSAAGDIFWDTWKKIEIELLECKSVVVIGWNMPATDIDIQSRISSVLNRRGHPIGQLIVCDIRKSELFYHRFEAIFRPRLRVKAWKDGFSEEFVRAYINP